MPKVARLLLALACALLLGGCMLVSGGQSSSDALPDGGNISASFVGADGSSVQTVNTGLPNATLSATVIVQAERGELQVSLLAPDSSVALVVRGRPQESVSRTGTVATDADGNLRYRISAEGARNGGYQVFYQRVP